jgi:hypothetical protein
VRPPSDRFVALIGHQRTGTHLLGTCIGSHPAVSYLDELTTHWRLDWLSAQAGTPADFARMLDRKFADAKEPWLLFDVKFNMIKHVPALEEFLRLHRVIGIIRENEDAWFYSFLHAHYRKERGLAEYGEADKAEAVADYPLPSLKYPEWLKTQETATKWAYYARFLYLADRIFSYEDLTQNVDVKDLPEWACHVICQYLDVVPMQLTTTLTKMSRV